MRLNVFLIQSNASLVIVLFFLLLLLIIAHFGYFLIDPRSHLHIKKYIGYIGGLVNIQLYNYDRYLYIDRH